MYMSNPQQRVEQAGRASWIGTCDHGDFEWVIERGTEHNAWRSLRAHLKDADYHS